MNFEDVMESILSLRYHNGLYFNISLDVHVIVFLRDVNLWVYYHFEI